jgi:hypothetical protein
LLSVASLEQQVSRYAKITLVFYTLSAHKQGCLDLCAMFRFPPRVIALDEEYASELTRWEEIANEIKHKTQTDTAASSACWQTFTFFPLTSTVC